MNQFRQLSGVFEEILTTEGGGIRKYLAGGQNALAHRVTGTSYKKGEKLGKIVLLFDQCHELLLLSTLPEKTRSEHLSYLSRLKSEFLLALLSGNDDAFQKEMKLPTNAMKLSLLGDLVEAAKAPISKELDRKNVVGATSELISSIVESTLPDYAKTALKIKLNAVISMANQSAIYPDEQVRLRIKAVVADADAEFKKFDAEFATLSEKVHKWAGTALKGSVFGLALIADGSAVAGLIEGPKQ